MDVSPNELFFTQLRFSNGLNIFFEILVQLDMQWSELTFPPKKSSNELSFVLEILIPLNVNFSPKIFSVFLQILVPMKVYSSNQFYPQYKLEFVAK